MTTRKNVEVAQVTETTPTNGQTKAVIATPASVPEVEATPAPKRRGRPAKGTNTVPSDTMTVHFNAEDTTSIRAALSVLQSNPLTAPLCSGLSTDSALCRFVVSMGLTAFHKAYNAS